MRAGRTPHGTASGPRTTANKGQDAESGTYGHRQVTTTQHNAPLSRGGNCTLCLLIEEAGQLLQRDIGRGLEWPEKAGHTERKVRGALHPYIWEPSTFRLVEMVRTAVWVPLCSLHQCR